MTITLKDAASDLLRAFEAYGEDPSRQGLADTPRRVASAWEEMLQGYSQDPQEIFRSFDSDGYQDIVLVKDIPFYSMCEHHLLPFFGVAHIGYIPDRKIVGLSKLARLLEIYARRLQVQERLTCQVADDLMKYLNPRGVMVVVEAEHLCMAMRGVQKPGTRTRTIATRGIFEDPLLQVEYFNLVK